MTLNTCSGGGLLGQSRKPIPRAPEEFAYPGRSDVVLCSNLVCSGCGARIRWVDGLTVRGGSDVVAQAYAAPNPVTVDGVSYGLQSQRLYLCRCTRYVAGGVVALALVDELPQLALPRTWACGGHPPVVLPVRIRGVEIPSNPDWSRIVEDSLRSRVNPKAPRASVHWLQEVHGVLSGTPHPAQIDALIASYLSSSDSVLRGQALHFLWTQRTYPATAALPSLVLGDAETLRSQADPLAHYADLYDLAVCILTFHVDRGCWPYEGAIQQAIRAHAATPGRLAGVGWLFQTQDKDWFLEHVDELLERSPGAEDKVARWRQAAGG